MEIVGTFLVFAVIAIVIRLMAGGLDRDRVAEYIRGQGGEVLDSQWSPFGTGWLGEKNDRIYDIRYRDRSGNIHEATVKTSILSGVYLTRDRIIAPARNPEPAEYNHRDLEEENERLRRRIAELESKRSQPPEN